MDRRGGDPVTLWTVPHAAIRRAAARKANLPLWRAGAVRVTTGLWATCQMIAGPVVTIHESDVLLEESVRNEAGAVPLKEVP